MIDPVPELLRPHLELAVSASAMEVALARPLGGGHRLSLAKLGGRLVEHFHSFNVCPCAPEVKP